MIRLTVFLVLALGFTLTIDGVSASGTADMKVSPPSQVVLDGTSFTSSVLQNATVTTTGAQTNITFNAAVVQIATVQAGAAYSGASFLMGVAPQTHQEAINEANTTGTLRNVSVFFSPGGGSVPPGETAFVQLNMQAKPGVEGPSPITLTSYEMLDDGSDTVAVTPFNGSVSVCIDNTDGDTLCNSAADPDDDNDGVSDTREAPCGSDPLDVTPPLSRPERIDGVFAAVDDDGDTLTDEALPGGAINTDCDGDGDRGSAENHVLQYLPGPPTNGDQKVCQEYDSTFPNSAAHVRPSKRWPSDVASGAFSANKVNVQDLSSYLAPVRYLGKNVGTNPSDVRFDIVPGSIAGAHINTADLAAIVAGATGFPPMYNGVKAYGGPVCPFAP